MSGAGASAPGIETNMRLDYLQPIIDAALNVLAEYTGQPVERGDMRLQQETPPGRDVAAVVSMAGEVEGRIVLEMDRKTALTIVQIMNREPFTELTPFALDTLMELTNVMIARAVTMLNDRGYSFCLAPPLVFTGANLSSFGSQRVETLVVPLRASAGSMDLNIALSMNRL